MDTSPQTLAPPQVLIDAGAFAALACEVHRRVDAVERRLDRTLRDDGAALRDRQGRHAHLHKDIQALRDKDEEDPLEVEASEFELNYIKLDGEVGCMVNGAGLAMATMDIIKYSGSSPANFLDVGGGTNVERVRNAFRILISDEDVQAVFINIFGGIVRCDRVAQGVVEALGSLEVKVPIIIRLQGTNAEEGAKILDGSDLEFTVALELREAAEAVAAAVKAA